MLFVDGSALFKWVGNKNRLLKERQNKILDAFTARKDEEYFATRVANEQIGENEYNLSVSRYMEPKDVREEIGIVAVNAEIARGDRPGSHPATGIQVRHRRHSRRLGGEGIVSRNDDLIQEHCPERVEFRPEDESGQACEENQVVR